MHAFVHPRNPGHVDPQPQPLRSDPDPEPEWDGFFYRP